MVLREQDLELGVVRLEPARDRDLGVLARAVVGAGPLFPEVIQDEGGVRLGNRVDPPGVGEVDARAPGAEVGDEHRVAAARYAVPAVRHAADAAQPRGN